MCSQTYTHIPAKSDAGTYPSCQRWFLPVSATRLRRYRCAVSRDERHCAATLRVRQDERSSDCGRIGRNSLMKWDPYGHDFGNAEMEGVTVINGKNCSCRIPTAFAKVDI